MHAAAATPTLADLLFRAQAAHGQGKLRLAAEHYHEALRAMPDCPQALLGLSLIARQAATPEAALPLAQAAVAANPRSALSWSNLGDLLLELAQKHAAEDGSPFLDRAQAAFARALQLDPDYAAAYFGLGNVLAHREECSAALSCFQRAAELAPARAEIAFAVAFTCGRLGRHGAAIEQYSRALKYNPGFASAWLNLGVELVADGRDELAAPCYGQAIQAARRVGRDPLTTELSAYLNLGHLARGRRHFLQAQTCYLRAQELAAAHPRRAAEVHLALVSLHLDQDRFPQAWISLRAAERSPGAERNAEIPNTRGILLLAEDAANVMDHGGSLIAEAVDAFASAEALGHKTAGSNRGNALLRLGRVNEALAAHQASLTRDPNHPGVRYNLALTQIRCGNYAEGWANYEIRWSFREVHPRPRRFTQQRWRGELISGLKNLELSTQFPQNSGLHDLESPALFLYAEQGLGDTIQFARYLPLVVQRLPGIRIWLEVQPALLRLFEMSFADLPVRLLAAGDPLPRFTHHCPLMSLPAVFATTLATVPNEIPYLRASARSPRKLPQSAASLTIGLNWAGNPRYRADRERSTTLATFAPLLSLPGIQWISLQKSEAARQIQSLPSHLRPIDAGSADYDLADTADTIAGLDLVLSTDSAVAHLAGALGKPLWLLLPWQADWRWMQNTDRTPWYPAARLWRQSSRHNWPELVARIADALAARVRESTIAGKTKTPATVRPSEAPLSHRSHRCSLL